MSLFFNYDKPGRGISREEAERRNYFEILGRKITLIIRANLLFFGVNIILFAILMYFALPFLINTDNQLFESLIEHLSLVMTGKQVMSPIPFVVLALFAPTVSGLTYLCRNFAKQEHVFLVSDFFEHTKKNFLQSFVAGIIMSAILYVYLTAFFFYWMSNLTVLVIILLVAGLVLSMASFYVFPLIVTFKMPLLAIFKNALLFSVINLPQNLLVLISLTALHILLMLNMPIIWLILMATFIVAFSSYTINFVAWNAINKYLESEATEQ